MTEYRSGVLMRSTIASTIWVLWALSIGVRPESSGVGVGRVVAFALVSLIAGVGVGSILEWMLLRGGRIASRFLHAVTRGLVGGTAGLTFALLLLREGGIESLPAAMVIIVPAIATPCLLDAMEQVARARDDILRRREQLVSEAANLMATSAAEAAVIAEIRVTIIAAVEHELAPARANVARRLAALERGTSLGSRNDGAGQLDDMAHDSLRPIIQTLDATREAQARPLGLLGTIRAIVRTQPFHPAPLAMIYVLTTLLNLWTQQGPVLALVNVAIGAAAIFAILGAGNLLLRRGIGQHAVVFIGTLVALQIPTVVHNMATVGGMDGAVSSATSALISAALVLLTSSLGSWRDRQEEAQQTFRALLDAERIDSMARARVTAEIARQVAQALHGPMQARLSACAVALDEAGRSGDIAGQIAALQSAEKALLLRLFDEEPDAARTLSTVLDAVAAPWEGLVDIRLETSGEQPSPEATKAIEQVVEEAITNAVRHGGAHHVVVQVEGSSDGHRITVDDDGRGALEALPGIGLTLYQRVTRGQWELTTSDALAGARLTAVVPC